MQIVNFTPFKMNQINSNNDYIMDPDIKIIETKIREMRINEVKSKTFVILRYQDGTEWVHLEDNPIERFCGFLYLINELKVLDVIKIQAVENKMAIKDKKIIYLSKYYGDEKPYIGYDFCKELFILNDEIRYTDTDGNRNLRKKDDTIYVFDTEKRSFGKSVRDRIDAFVEQHNALRSILEERL